LQSRSEAPVGVPSASKKKGAALSGVFFYLPELDTDGLTGAEIEQVFIDAMYRAFAEEEEPSDFTIGEVLVDFVPLSKLMAEQITGLRQWAKGRARNATTQPVERKVRRIAA